MIQCLRCGLRALPSFVRTSGFDIQQSTMLMPYRKMMNIFTLTYGSPVWAIYYGATPEGDYFSWSIANMLGQGALLHGAPDERKIDFVRWGFSGLNMKHEGARQLADVAVLFSASSRDWNVDVDFTSEEFGLAQGLEAIHVPYEFVGAACLSLPDLWLEPTLYAEFDMDRDHGIYFNLDVGHAFTLCGDDENPLLAVRVDVAQGVGDAKRNEAYTAVSRGGFMDTMIRLTFEWKPFEHLTVAPYAAYYDYLFDRHLREGARCASYGGDPKNESWNFIGGITFRVCF